MLLSGLAALPFATPRPARAATRRFRMGTSRWPPDLTLGALGQVELYLRDQADMAAPMILGGVPWQAALDGAPFSAALQAELAWRSPGGHPRCLSLGALDTLRRGLAPLYAVRDNQPLPPDWAGRAFDDPQVIAAYREFCLRAVEISRPNWLVIGVEVNLLLHFAPDLWPAYMRLHRAAHEAVKERFPDLPVGFSIGAQHFLGIADKADTAVQRAAMEDLASHADWLGFSIYPHVATMAPEPIPPGFYDPLSDLAARLGKPAAVTESGTSSRPVRIGWTTLPGTDERQVQATDALLRLAEEGGHLFFVNWASHDFPALLEKLPDETRSLAALWAHTGIRDGTGADKPVSQVWNDWLTRTRA